MLNLFLKNQYKNKKSKNTFIILLVISSILKLSLMTYLLFTNLYLFILLFIIMFFDSILSVFISDELKENKYIKKLVNKYL